MKSKVQNRDISSATIFFEGILGKDIVNIVHEVHNQD